MADVGAGFGRLSEFYDRFQEVILIDYARSILLEARQRLGDRPNIRYVVANVYNLPLVDGAVDAIQSVRVAHHLRDVSAAMTEINRILCHGGCLVLEFANKRNLKAIARHVVRTQPDDPFAPDPLEFVELNYNFHPDWMLERLDEAGFLIQSTRAVSYLRIPALKRIVPASWLAALDGYLQPTARWGAYSPSIFVRARSVRGASLASGPLFRCPACGTAPLEEHPTACLCPNCHSEWPIEDGIYLFREDS
jgi:SAM-dependent methyltransferase